MIRNQISPMKKHFVIIGNGVAGVTAARALSDAGVEVEVYTQEAYHYYPRPRLQRFLAGEIELEELPLYPPTWYEKRGIAVHLETEVTELDPRVKRIALADGREVFCDRLLLATGSRPFIPPIEGLDKDGVFTLRTIEDALAIKRWACPERCPELVEGPSRRAERSKRAVVIGGGLLGLEAARALMVLGLKVIVLESEPYLLQRQLDAEGGALLRELIEAMGIEVILEASSQAVLGGETSPPTLGGIEGGLATGVLLQDGRRIEGDLILISTGIRSNVKLAQEAGLEVHRGVVVDEHLRTSAEDIYAAGDVAEFRGRVYGIILAAIEQARAAAQNMLGEEGTYHGTIPSNNLEVMGIDCTSIGVVHPPEGVGYQELRKSGAGVYKKLVLKDERLVGAILLGDRKDIGAISRLIQRGADVSRYTERLLDENFDWKELL
jgi:nitrite reductase (NADH) large subunit